MRLSLYCASESRVSEIFITKSNTVCGCTLTAPYVSFLWMRIPMCVWRGSKERRKEERETQRQTDTEGKRQKQKDRYGDTQKHAHSSLLVLLAV